MKTSPWLRGKPGEDLTSNWHLLPPPWTCTFEFIHNWHRLCDQLNWIPGPSSHTSSAVILSCGREQMNMFTKQITLPSTKPIERGLQTSPSFVDYGDVASKQERPEPFPAGHWSSTNTHLLSQLQKLPFSLCCILWCILLWIEPKGRVTLKPTAETLGN